MWRWERKYLGGGLIDFVNGFKVGLQQQKSQVKPFFLWITEGSPASNRLLLFGTLFETWNQGQGEVRPSPCPAHRVGKSGK
jgi:hypothetical protein